MKKTKLAALLAAAALALSGCGNDGYAERSQQVRKELASVFQALASKGDAPAPKATSAQVIATTMAKVPNAPLLFVQAQKEGYFAVASEYGTNGNVKTWITYERRSVALDRGVLTATRGWGNDLMSVEDGGAISLVRARRAGQVRKVYRFLDGEDFTGRAQFDCTITPGGSKAVVSGAISTTATQVVERCSVPGFSFDNVYFVDGSGRIVQSVQWAGARIGSLALAQLRW